MTQFKFKLCLSYSPKLYNRNKVQILPPRRVSKRLTNIMKQDMGTDRLTMDDVQRRFSRNSDLAIEVINE